MNNSPRLFELNKLEWAILLFSVGVVVFFLKDFLYALPNREAYAVGFLDQAQLYRDSLDVQQMHIFDEGRTVLDRCGIERWEEVKNQRAKILPDFANDQGKRMFFRCLMSSDLQ